ncbi:MAG: Xaa-Pro peptidase family protein [Thermodesulfobacteriota bacterium]
MHMVSLEPFVWPDRNELEDRGRRLQELLSPAGWDGALLLQNADLLYFCGTTQAEAVFIPAEGEPLVLARPPFDRCRSETTLPKVAAMPRWPDLGKVLEDHAGRPLAALGLELDVMAVNFFHRLAEAALNGLETPDVSPLVHRVRAIKSEYELSQMRAAARLLDAMFQAVPGLLARGLSEMELEGRLIALAKAHGHQGLIRSRGFNMEMSLGHILSGPSGLVPAKVASPTGGTGINPGFGQGAGPRLIGSNELVSVDLCGAFGGYIVDQARLFFTGPTPERVRTAYALLRDLIEEVKDFIRPGVLSGQVYDRTFAAAEKRGLLDHFMNLDGGPCPFVGHGVGLELDEWPALARGSDIPLAAGMTFALEPRVFLPEYGVVGLEDTYLLTENGPEYITLTSREIRVVEREGA